MPETLVAAPALPPGAAVDAAAVRAAGARLVPLGQPVADHGEETVRSWRWIGDHYHAPETPVLLAALDPLVEATDTASRRILGLGTALTVWADGIEPIIAELRRLGAAGTVTPAEAGRMTELIAELANAEVACVNAIRSILADGTEPSKIKTGEHVDEDKATLSVGFVQVGVGNSFKVTTFSDGTVEVTALVAPQAGGTASPGSLDFGGGFTAQSGDTWRFQDGTEAARLLDELKRYVAERQKPTPAGKGSFPIGALLRPPRPPDLTVTELGAQASAEAGVEGPVAEGTAKGEGAVKETVTHDRTNGTVQSTLTTEGALALDGTFAPLGVGPRAGAVQQDKVELGRSVTRDEATGRITGIELTRTVTGTDSASGGGAGPGDASGGQHRAPGVSVDVSGKAEHTESTVRVTTTTLEVTEENRALVEKWVADGRPDLGTPAGVDGLHDPDRAVPGDDFQNLLHREAKVGEVTYEETKDATTGEAEVKAGAKVGGEGQGGSSSSRAVQASHLGDPGPDDVRRPVPDPESLTP